MEYRHRQVGWPLLVISDVLIIVGVLLMFLGGAGFATGVVLVIVGLFVVMMSVLTVTVDGSHIGAAFFLGWPKHRVALDDVSSAARVRNKAWWGFGIRKVPGGWMYNVGGLDAVELTQRSGKKFRVGTDDIEELIDALRGAGVATPT